MRVQENTWGHLPTFIFKFCLVFFIILHILNNIRSAKTLIQSKMIFAITIVSDRKWKPGRKSFFFLEKSGAAHREVD